jgi:hypothetical protein
MLNVERMAIISSSLDALARSLSIVKVGGIAMTNDCLIAIVNLLTECYYLLKAMSNCHATVVYMECQWRG